jgi:hypothetical protein
MASPLVTFDYSRRKGIPRPASTYRGRRRNDVWGSVWRGVEPTAMACHPPVRANRRDRTKVREAIVGTVNWLAGTFSGARR